MRVGVDLGGTKVEVGLVRNGKVVKWSRRLIEQEKGRKHILSRIREAIHEVAVRPSLVAIGVPGYYAGTRTKVLPNTAPLNNTDLKRGLKLSCKVVLCNDAKAFTLAEALRGAGKNKRVVLGITLGTGVGSGLVIDGKIFTGSRAPKSHRGEGGVPELGHVIIDPSVSSFVENGRRKDWESLLSGRAFFHRYKRHGGAAHFPREIWTEKSPAARQTREETARFLAVFCANAVRMYAPDVIVLGGSVANAWLVKRANALLPSYGVAPVLKLSSCKDAAILGAVLAEGSFPSKAL